MMAETKASRYDRRPCRQPTFYWRRTVVNRWLWGSVCACIIAGCSQQTPPQSSAVAAPPLVSGIDTQYIDDSVRAQDDLYQHVNGTWLASTEIPADKGSYDQ